MTLDANFLRILLCPVERTPLTEADAELLAQVNLAIQQQRLRDRVGQPLTVPLEAALVNQDRRLLYPVTNGIPCLVADEAISLQQLEETSA